MIDYIIQDYQSHRLRALSELVGMILALWVSMLFMMTTPHVPLVPAYLGWNTSALILGICSWHRGSFGLAMTYGGFLIIDTIGFLRTIGVLE